ncbi:MAG: hypothetical protein AAGE52_42135 [Myxococcota bacterium]
MQLDIGLRGDSISIGNGFSVNFQRTLRIPDDGKSYPLPPGLGRFPIRRIDDYLDRVPKSWAKRGGVLIPIYQREAMWLSFSSASPHAVQVGVGKVCAITGEPWSDSLSLIEQNYVVTPSQPWLDGINIGNGLIRQFVAMPLGMGYTVEGQVTGKETFGGLQLQVFQSKEGAFPEVDEEVDCCLCEDAAEASAGGMGLAAGGQMSQKIYPDPYDFDVWNPERSGRVFVHLVNSQQWREITGEAPPETPVTAKEYARHGFPWFELYDEKAATLPGSKVLKKVKSVATKDQTVFGTALQDESPVSVPTTITLKHPNGVRDGDW